jgi:hypothetical protein
MHSQIVIELQREEAPIDSPSLSLDKFMSKQDFPILYCESKTSKNCPTLEITASFSSEHLVRTERQ